MFLVKGFVFRKVLEVVLVFLFEVVNRLLIGRLNGMSSFIVLVAVVLQYFLAVWLCFNYCVMLLLMNV